MPDIHNTALEHLFQTNYDTMLRLAYRMLGDMSTAEDLVQQTFLLALIHERDLMEHPSPPGWLVTTLKFLIQNERRKLENQTDSLEAHCFLAETERSSPLEHILPQQLPREDRELLIWRFEQQLEYREIAERLGISQVGCRSRVARALKRCKKWMEPFPFHPTK